MHMHHCLIQPYGCIIPVNDDYYYLARNTSSKAHNAVMLSQLSDT